MESTDAPIYRLTPSPIRRWIGVALLLALGGLVLYLALGAAEMAVGWRVFLIALGGGALWAAAAMWRATEHSVELTAEGLRETSGRMLAPIAAIRSVDRGAFAFKPSNGFLVRLNEPAQRGWAPGLWWRFGKSLGVGGVTNRDDAKLMADLISRMLMERGT